MRKGDLGGRSDRAAGTRVTLHDPHRLGDEPRGALAPWSGGTAPMVDNGKP